jgi:hypothetical protein
MAGRTLFCLHGSLQPGRVHKDSGYIAIRLIQHFPFSILCFLSPLSDSLPFKDILTLPLNTNLPLSIIF